MKGKVVELASTSGIEGHRELAAMFMSDIFDLESGDYLITDESSLHDFADGNIGDILAKVEDLHGINIADVTNANLLEIFRRLSR